MKWKKCTTGRRCGLAQKSRTGLSNTDLTGINSYPLSTVRVCVYESACTYVCVCLIVALKLILELQHSADSSTYLTLPPTLWIILWRECDNTSRHNSEPGHPMASWTTSLQPLTGVMRGSLRISSTCLGVTVVCGVWIEIHKQGKNKPHTCV